MTTSKFTKILLGAVLLLGAMSQAQADDKKVDPTGTYMWTMPSRNGGADRTNTLVLKLDGDKPPDQKVSGMLMPMVANDGPHYGDNVKLQGPGKYKMTLTIAPPTASPHAMFGRHVDKETGVGPWFAPFTVEYECVYAGTGKKGAY